MSSAWFIKCGDLPILPRWEKISLFGRRLCSITDAKPGSCAKLVMLPSTMDGGLRGDYEVNMNGEPCARKPACTVRKGTERKGLVTAPRSQSTLHHLIDAAASCVRGGLNSLSLGHYYPILRSTTPARHRNSVPSGASSASGLDRVGVLSHRLQRCCVPHCEGCACLESRSRQRDDSRRSAVRSLEAHQLSSPNRRQCSGRARTLLASDCPGSSYCGNPADRSGFRE